MTEINVVVTGPEEAYNYEAEFWCANEQIGETVLHEGRCTCASIPAPTARRGWPTSAASGARWPRPSSGSRRTEAAP